MAGYWNIHDLGTWRCLYLHCSACGMGQKASESTVPFVHDAKCRSASGRNPYPWHELANILNLLPRGK